MRLPAANCSLYGGITRKCAPSIRLFESMSDMAIFHSLSGCGPSLRRRSAVQQHTSKRRRLRIILFRRWQPAVRGRRPDVSRLFVPQYNDK
jgi:hypothetical protein